MTRPKTAGSTVIVYWSQLVGNFAWRARPAPITSLNFAAFSPFHTFPAGQARLAERDKRREAKNTAGKSPRPTEGTITLKALSERFLSQTREQNARDPELRRAQSLVAQTISITRAKYPDDPVKASKEVEARRQEVARRIAAGDKIATIQVRNQQAQRVREVTQEQVLQRDGRSR